MLPLSPNAPPSLSPFTSLCRHVYVFSSFHTSLTLHIHFSLLLPFCRLPLTHTYPPNLKPLDVGIQFVLYVSFLLRFRFISCRLLLINSLDMQ